MFDIGLSELLLIVVVAIIVVGPKDLPVVIRHVARFAREVRSLAESIRGQVSKLADEVGIDELKREVTTIVDLEGKPQIAYDVRTLEDLKPKADSRDGTPAP